MAPAACHSGSAADVASAYWSTVVGRATANAVVAGRATGSTVGVGEGSRMVVATAGGASSVSSPELDDDPDDDRGDDEHDDADDRGDQPPRPARGRWSRVRLGGGCGRLPAATGRRRLGADGGGRDGPVGGLRRARPAGAGREGGSGAVGGFGCIACQLEIGGVGGPAGRSGPGRPVSLIGAPPCITSPEPSPDAPQPTDGTSADHVTTPERGEPQPRSGRRRRR